MAKRKYNKSTGRDYDYDTEYQSSPEQKKNRAARGRARYALEKAGKVRKGDGKDVDHKDGNPRNNSKKNLRAMPKGKNRAKH
jgi:hypothetical protein